MLHSFFWPQGYFRTSVILCVTFICCWELIESTDCFTCNDTFIGMRRCGSRPRKEVDFSGICSIEDCGGPLSCSHQIGVEEPNECLLYKSSSWSGLDPVVLKEDVFTCSESDQSCGCPNPSSAPASRLERAVSISAYPYRCDCTLSNYYSVALDIRVRLPESPVLGLVLDYPPQDDERHTPRWLLFRLSEAAAARPAGVLRYDCPVFRATDQNRAMALHLCTRHESVRYQLRLPLRRDIENGAWQPLPIHHAHRHDRLVFSVQRAPPPPRCTRFFRLQLVVCAADECSSMSRPIQDTLREVKEECSESESEPGSFLVEYELPKISGRISLEVLPLPDPDSAQPLSRYNATYSAFIIYEATSQVEMWLAVTVLLVVLVLLVAAVVWIKYFKPAPPEYMDVLVVYNSNAALARSVVRSLEKYCRVTAQLDIVHIPTAVPAMDPVAWLTKALSRCQRVLLLVFPEQAAPPIYRRIFPVTVQYLKQSTEKTVVIGYSGSEKLVPRGLPTARRFQLPGQLPQLVTALRGGGRCSWRWLQAMDLARELRRSPEGKQLERQLRAPHVTPPEEVALSLAPLTLVVPEPVLPRPPARPTDLMAAHVPDLDALLPPAQSSELAATADDGDDEIDWH